MQRFIRFQGDNPNPKPSCRNIKCLHDHDRYEGQRFIDNLRSIRDETRMPLKHDEVPRQPSKISCSLHQELLDQYQTDVEKSPRGDRYCPYIHHCPAQTVYCSRHAHLSPKEEYKPQARLRCGHLSGEEEHKPQTRLRCGHLSGEEEHKPQTRHECHVSSKGGKPDLPPLKTDYFSGADGDGVIYKNTNFGKESSWPRSESSDELPKSILDSNPPHICGYAKCQEAEKKRKSAELKKLLEGKKSAHKVYQSAELKKRLQIKKTEEVLKEAQKFNFEKYDDKNSLLESAREHCRQIHARFTKQTGLNIPNTDDGEEDSESKKTVKVGGISGKCGHDLRKMVCEQIKEQDSKIKAKELKNKIERRKLVLPSLGLSDLSTSTENLCQVKPPSAVESHHKEVNTDPISEIPKNYLAVSAMEMVTSKVIAPMARRIQRMYLNNLNEEMAILEELDRVPCLVNNVYQSAEALSQARLNNS